MIKVSSNAINDINKLYRNAINRTLTKVARKQRELIKENLLIKDKTIKNLTRTKRASPYSNEASITSFTNIALSPNVFKYKKEKRDGVEIKINEQKKVFLQGAFSIKPKKGGRVIVTRNKNAHPFYAQQASITSTYLTKRGMVERIHTDLFYLKSKKGFFEVVKEANEVLIKEIPDILQKEISS